MTTRRRKRRRKTSAGMMSAMTNQPRARKLIFPRGALQRMIQTRTYALDTIARLASSVEPNADEDFMFVGARDALRSILSLTAPRGGLSDSSVMRSMMLGMPLNLFHP